jgi:tripartite-type tricarboxylate transporter receptor subunit TctC
LRLLSSTSALSRPLLGPPEVPAERVETLRAAFDATMKDAGFLADAKKSGMDIKPMSGARIQQIVQEIVASAPADVALAAELVK